MGVANHARYLDWFSEGRVAWLKDLGESYALWEEGGKALPVIGLGVKYRTSARFMQKLSLSTALLKCDRRTLAFGYQLHCQNTLLAEAVTRHCLLQGGRAVRIAAEFVDRFQHHLQPDFVHPDSSWWGL